MNIFQLLGDLSHLYSIVILIYKIHTKRTTAGISLRTRLLYLLVFLARYGDLFLYFISFYNSFMKIAYIAMTSWIVYLMLFSEGYKRTWYADLDDFPTIPLLIGSVIFGLGGTEDWSVFEVLWTFSIVLESVAVLPQIYHLTKVPTLPALPLSHLVALGLYRFFYVLNWIFRIETGGWWDFTAFFFGCVQTILWADFLWVWYNRKQIRLTDLSTPAVNPQANGNVSIGAQDAQQVDSGDLARSFLLSHIFRASRAIESKFLTTFGGGTRSGLAAGLSVQAYPERDLRTAEEGRTGFTDASTEPGPATNGSTASTTPTTAAKSIEPIKEDQPRVSVETKAWQEQTKNKIAQADDFDDDDL